MKLDKLNQKFGLGSERTISAPVLNNRLDKLGKKYGVDMSLPKTAPAAFPEKTSVPRVLTLPKLKMAQGGEITQTPENIKALPMRDTYVTPHAQEFLDRMAEEETQRAIEQAQAEAQANTLAGIARNVYGGMVGSFAAPVGAAVDAIEGKPLDINAPYMRLTQQANAAQQTLQDKQAEALGLEDGSVGRKVSDLGVGSGLSILQTLARLPLAQAGVQSKLGGEGFVGQAVKSMTSPSLASLQAGLSAGTSAVIDAKDKGASDKQAVAQGLAQGFNEGLFESWSLGNLVNDDVAITSFKEYIKETAKQMGVEGSEEFFTDIANDIADRIIMGEKSEYNTLKNKYRAEGESDSTAAVLAEKDIIGNALYSFAGGALSGLVLGGGKGLTNIGKIAPAQTENQNLSSDGTEQTAVNQTEQVSTETAKPAETVTETTVNTQETAANTQETAEPVRYETKRQRLARLNQAAADIVAEGSTDEAFDNVLDREFGDSLKPDEIEYIDRKVKEEQQNTVQPAQTEQNTVQAEKRPVQNAQEVQTAPKEVQAEYAAQNIEQKPAAERNTVKTETKAEKAHREIQNEIIQKANPATDDYHTWIRSADDISTFEEEAKELATGQDFTAEDAAKAVETGKVTVYSSKPINNGTWVTPSRMEAQNYAGDGRVYSREMNVNDIAWVKGSGANEGQVAITGKLSKGTKNGKNVSDERGGRALPLRTGITEERVSGKAGENKTEHTFKGRAADQEFSGNQKVSERAADEVIRGAKKDQKLYITEKETKTMQRARKLAEKAGVKNVAMFASDEDIKLENGSEVRAVYDPETDSIAVRANGSDEDAVNLVKHELAERQIAKGEITVKELTDELEEKIGEDNFNKILDAYIGEDVSEYDSDRQQEIIAAAMNEVACDYKAGINQFRSVEGYEDLSNVMAEALGEVRTSVKISPKTEEAVKAKREENLRRAIEALRRANTDITKEQIKITDADVREAYEGIKAARRMFENSSRKNGLTKKENSVLNLLINGELGWEETTRMEDVDVTRIRRVYEAKKEYDRLSKIIKEAKKQRLQERAKVADRILDGFETWKDHKGTWKYDINTAERNSEYIAPAQKAKEINETYFRPIHKHVAESQRYKTLHRDTIKELNLSRKVDKGNKVSESEAVQFIGEAEDNLRRAEHAPAINGFSQLEWDQKIREFWAENPNLDRNKIQNAIEVFRTEYDHILSDINEVRIRNGYEPIPYRKGYFMHFQDGEQDTALAAVKKAFGINTESVQLPTAINGQTRYFRPGIKYMSAALERKGFDTKMDAVQGFDRYIETAADVIYLTDDIQNLRSFARQIRFNSSDEGRQKQILTIMENDDLGIEEKGAAISQLYADDKAFALSSYVVWLDEYTNQLAGKRAEIDRTMERLLGRGALYNTIKSLESKLGANMVAVNPGSWLTNFIPITQAFTTTEARYILKGMTDTIKNTNENDGLIDRSEYLTNRLNQSERLVKNFEQNANPGKVGRAVQGYSKLIDAIAKKGGIIDDITTESVYRARYLENLDKGMSELSAIEDADDYTARIQAARSKGSMPTVFGSSNPFFKAFTMFQLEVQNEVAWIMYDLPKEFAEKTAAQVVASVLKLLVAKWMFNDIFEYLFGRRPAADPIDLVNNTVGDITGYKLPNMIDLATGKDDFKTKKKGAWETVVNAGEQIAENVPFASGVLGGGRVPISSALPDLEKIGKTMLGDGSKAYKSEVLKKELKKPALYLILPGGGGQIKKTAEGIKALWEGGSYTTRKDGQRALQYPVYTDSTSDKISSGLRALVFGPSSLKEQRDWVENDFDSLSEKKTALYDTLKTEMQDREAFKIVEEFTSISKTDEESEKNAKMKYIRSMKASENVKKELYMSMYSGEDRDKAKAKIEAAMNNGVKVNEFIEFSSIKKTEDESERIGKLQYIMESKSSDKAKKELFLQLYSGEDRDKAEEKLSGATKKGIGIEDYIFYQKARAEGVKKDEAVKRIDSLDLTIPQKDYLFLLDYAESTIDEAPWRHGSQTKLKKK